MFLKHIHKRFKSEYIFFCDLGYSSNERPGLDSYFIRTIIKVFSAEACKEDIMTLLNKVKYYKKEHQVYLCSICCTNVLYITYPLEVIYLIFPLAHRCKRWCQSITKNRTYHI